jgi:hypothetical protein
MIKNFLAWIYSDPKYSASYYKNLIEKPPSTPKAPVTQHPSSEPSEPKATPKAKGSGKGFQETAWSTKAQAASLATQQPSPPIMQPPPSSTQPQPQPSNAASSSHNPNPTQPVDGNRVIKALFEATLGNQYTPELIEEIQHDTTELLEKLARPTPPPEVLPTIPEKSLQ